MRRPGLNSICCSEPGPAAGRRDSRQTVALGRYISGCKADSAFNAHRSDRVERRLRPNTGLRSRLFGTERISWIARHDDLDRSSRHPFSFLEAAEAAGRDRDRNGSPKAAAIHSATQSDRRCADRIDPSDRGEGSAHPGNLLSLRHRVYRQSLAVCGDGDSRSLVSPTLHR